ncbi:hypothetical protein Taro_007729 [Colocasia esculenta]|uniref:Uncharacterized protein n=1 Tax=Colocasia esculenta TaxID=4460 RepID=A0A843U164_COLES|nr:hypothetical protein [Colocasia esculenta]
MPRVASALCLAPLVLRESCLARPWLWVGVLLCFRCFVVLCNSLLPLLLEFLLLWLVRDWLSLLSLVREAHPPTLSRWLAFQQGPSVSCRRMLLLLMGARAASVVDGLLVLRLSSTAACASVWPHSTGEVVGRSQQLVG